MTNKTDVRCAYGTLCDRMMDLRQFSFVDSADADAADQVVLNLIEEFRAGRDSVGPELAAHSRWVIAHLVRAGYEDEDEVFLAEVAIDEAIAAGIAMNRGI